MFRLIVIALVIVLVLTLVRAFAGIFRQVLTSALDATDPAAGAPNGAGNARQGSLERDPVCGTFVAAETSVKKTVGGEIVHFCSRECRDQYQAG